MRMRIEIPGLFASDDIAGPMRIAVDSGYGETAAGFLADWAELRQRWTEEELPPVVEVGGLPGPYLDMLADGPDGDTVAEAVRSWAFASAVLSQLWLDQCAAERGLQMAAGSPS